MASLNLKNIYKVYPNGTKAVNDFSMDIEDKEFIVFVGPSGCGKSTVLRMIAGLEEITAGELKIDGVVVNDVQCKSRDTAMVFQNYALYPHMTVAENMAFPMKMAGLSKEQKAELNAQIDAVYPPKTFGKDAPEITEEERAQVKAQLKERKNEKTQLTEEDKAEIKRRVKVRYSPSLKNNILKPLHNSRVRKEYVSELRGEEIKRLPSILNNILRPYRRNQLKNKMMIDKVEETAKILDLQDYLVKKPGAMSGGQRQRVALGRAMVRQPKVFLLDEPLSNLDAKLRTQMRSEITKLHARLQTTFIYVTHDQTEAMTMGDRIVVMKKGEIQQIDTPLNLYSYPANLFVAGFIGTPAMNFFDATVTTDGKEAEIVFANGKKLSFEHKHIRKLEKKYLGKEIVFGVRPEDFVLSDDGVECVVSSSEMLGSETLLYCDFDTENANSFEKSKYGFIVKAEGICRRQAGEKIKVNVNFAKAHYFDKQTESSVMPRFVSYNDLSVKVTDGKLSIGGQSALLPPALGLKDGEYGVTFPSCAVKRGEDFTASVCECEQLRQGWLARMEIDGVSLYALFDSYVEGEVGISFEWHTFNFALGGEIVKAALKTDNQFKVTLAKRRLSPEQKKSLNKDEYRAFDVDVVCGEKKLGCPYAALKRLLGASDRKLFGTPMLLKFDNNGITEGDEFSATVKEIYDYGSARYALCSCMGNEIVLPYNGQDKQINFCIDLNVSGIYEEQTGIKIA